ncbi:MAG: DUF4340 domain-containing protein [Verrucomicrobiota bacterium]
MRSLGFTLILGLLALGVSAVAAWQWIAGNFDSVLGAPATPVGERIYSSFTPEQVKSMRISQNGTTATFALGPDGWHSTSPWQDRMDPRAAVDIVNFTLGLRVEDIAEVGKVDAQKAGLRDSGVNIRLEDGGQKVLAKYKLGRLTPWLATVKDVEEPVRTVFVQPRDEDHKDYIYACTGDITSHFKDNLKFLRDHHPFYFNPLALQKIRIRTAEGELTLAREAPTSPWRIIMPQELATDIVAVKSLIEGLYELNATKLTDRAAVTVPAVGSPATSHQIAITAFGQDTETVLEMMPQTPESTEVMATVSNRPGTVFTLPSKPDEAKLSLAELPLTIIELRDPTLTHLNRTTLRGIRIQPASGSEILISRAPKKPWNVTINGKVQDVNEGLLFNLLQTVTTGKATAFVTDAATDFTPWGLDKPLLTLSFQGNTEAEVLELRFGTDGKGGYFVNRTGTPTVMGVDAGLVSAIPVKAFEWRPSRLWSIDRVNLLALRRQAGNEPPLTLLYDFDTDTWTADCKAENVTSRLDPTRAGYLLGILEGLQVTRWLSPIDEAAQKALLTPSLQFLVIENQTDDMGDTIGRITRSVILAPATSGENPLFYYGRLSSDEQPFMLDRDTYTKLATRVIETQ